MMTATVGRLERVPLREVWPHEERDFTPWLEANIDVLNDVIDVPIASVDREQAAGTFSVDLVGVDESGRRVVVENQFGKCNHDHLGKLLTYLTALNARVAV
jgi:RecB family endonuclease NucS